MSALLTEVNSLIGTGGDWNEEGLIRGLDRKGFTPSLCGSELIANSCDSRAKNIKFVIDETSQVRTIKLIDDGTGMVITDLKNMFSMHKSNNSKKSSMGVSGIGGKEALYILSKGVNGQATTVIIYTRSAGGAYLKAVVPWDKIISELKYTGQVQYFNMSETEIAEFNLEREGETGTTIKWEYSSNFHNLLLLQFEIEKFGKYQTLKNRWDVVFGNVEIDITYDDGKKQKPLYLYNYFSGELADYFMNKIVTHKIDHYVDKSSGDHFVWENMECKTNSAGACSKTPTPIYFKQMTLVGQYDFDIALRKNRANDYIFNEHTGEWLVDASVTLCEYDEPYFDTDNNKNIICDELCCTQLIRNNQYITHLELNDFNPSTARGNADSMLQRFHIRSRLRYCTLSTQDNPMDIAMGIQENKNQHQNEVPKSLNYLLSYLKKEYIKLLTKHFYDTSKNIKQKREEEEKKKHEEAKKHLLEEDEEEEEEEPKVEEEASEAVKVEEETSEAVKVEEEASEAVKVEEEASEAVKPKVEEEASEAVKPKVEEEASEAVKPKVEEEETSEGVKPKVEEEVKQIDNNERLNKIIQYLIAVQVGEKQMLSVDIIEEFENKLFN